MPKTANPATITQCARRLRACAKSTAALWDAARELEIELGREVDGIGALVENLAVCGTPTLRECEADIRDLFKIKAAKSRYLCPCGKTLTLRPHPDGASVGARCPGCGMGHSWPAGMTP